MKKLTNQALLYAVTNALCRNPAAIATIAATLKNKYKSIALCCSTLYTYYYIQFSGSLLGWTIFDEDINTNNTSTPPPTPAAATSPPL